MYLAVNKETDPKILKALHEGYRKLVESGEKEAISQAYGL